MINKNLPEDILFQGITYLKGETEIPVELEELVNKLNQMVSPQVEQEEAPRVPNRKAK